MRRLEVTVTAVVEVPDSYYVAAAPWNGRPCLAVGSRCFLPSIEWLQHNRRGDGWQPVGAVAAEKFLSRVIQEGATVTDEHTDAGMVMMRQAAE